MDAYTQNHKILNLIYTILNIKITNTSITNFINIHPYPKSISLIGDALAIQNIDSLVLDLSSYSLNDIRDINTPLITYKEEEGYKEYVIITDLNDNFIYYYSLTGKKIKENWLDFKKNWSGLSLIVLAKEPRNEYNYKLKRIEEIIQSYSPKILVSIGLLYFISVFSEILIEYNILISILVVLKFIGTSICLILFLHESSQRYSFVDKICHLGKSNCNSILKSKDGKILSVFIKLCHLKNCITFK